MLKNILINYHRPIKNAGRIQIDKHRPYQGGL